MALIDRIRDKYLQQNPTRDPQFTVAPDWLIAGAEVLDEELRAIRKDIAAIKNRNDSA